MNTTNSKIGDEPSILSALAEIDEPIRIAQERREALSRPLYEERNSELAQLKERLRHEVASSWTIDPGTGAVATDRTLSVESRDLIRSLAEHLHPWRKGPFRFGELFIDSEWRSNMKWDRLAKALQSIKLDGKTVADVGCGNGYYMFRLLEFARARGEELSGLIGLDPSENFHFQFDLLSTLLGESRCCYELLGIEELRYFPEKFDLILFMGVLYHQRDPEQALKVLCDSLKPGGSIIVESLVVPGEGMESLKPEDRYAKMRNVHLVPSVGYLSQLMKLAGFEEVTMISCEVTEFEEQRRTKFMRFESLEDFISPDDPQLTVEGYPRPRRAIFSGKRPKISL